ncbi:hypothetical protein HAX54_037971 [Datura stramonium]|uniref:Uncharacterized protein n=1 Tax=Datura stramonium TaxID=4076 RepID=A0ABS8VKD8_DATST|nr:hypothetical protein [Datura stramonium]
MIQGVKKEEFEKSLHGEIAGMACQPPNFIENYAQKRRARSQICRILTNTLARWLVQCTRDQTSEESQAKCGEMSGVAHHGLSRTDFLILKAELVEGKKVICYPAYKPSLGNF